MTTTRARVLVLVASAMFVLPSCDEADLDPDAPIGGKLDDLTPSSCEHAGFLYPVGASRPDDVCLGNTCTCQEGGFWVCTELACAPSSCDHAGVAYAVGASRPDDVCPGNTCTCQDGGSWACTELVCAPR